LPQQRRTQEHKEIIAKFVNLTYYPEGWGEATGAQSSAPVSMYFHVYERVAL